MAAMGITVEGATLIYVVATTADGLTVTTEGSLTLKASRDAEAIKVFGAACRHLYEKFEPTLIAVREKPETGRMRSGAMASKIEALILLHAPCPVTFVPARDIAAVNEISLSIKKKSEGAFRALSAASAAS